MICSSSNQWPRRVGPVRNSEGNLTTITPNQTFKHDRETYEQGERYEVSDEDAAYFRETGWLGERSAANGEISIDVHDIGLGHEARVN